MLTPGDIPDLGPGPSVVYLWPYLVANDDNLADAISEALEDHPTGKICLEFPPGDYDLDRQVGDFLGSDGLRGNITFSCAGICHITRPVGAVFEAMFAFPSGTENVTWRNIYFHLADTAVVGCKAIQSYNNTNWRVEGCGFVCDDVPTNQGNGIALGLFGCYSTIVTDCYFKRGQCGFAGLGYGCNGVIFDANVCEDVHDFAVSAVTGPPEETPLEIKNVVISDNTIRGVNGTGAIFVGSDGGSSPADVVSGIEITGNTIVGAVEEGHIGVRTLIVVCSGIETFGVDVSNNTINDDDASAQTQYGIYVSTCTGGTSFSGLTVNNNRIGSLGAGGGVNGIYIDTTILDNSQICHNTLDGNRGIFVANARNTKISDNSVFNASSHAIHVRASTRNVSGLDVSRNYAYATGAFSNGILFEVDGAWTLQAWLDDNKMSSASASALSFVPDGGSGSFYQTDQKFVSGGADAAMIAATTFDRDPS